MKYLVDVGYRLVKRDDEFLHMSDVQNDLRAYGEVI
jgi:hypothetical protein